MPQPYKLSSVQINLPRTLANEIIEWGHVHLADADIYEQPGYGREDEIHVTVLYGIEGEGVSLVRATCQDFKPFPVTLGAVGLFVNRYFDVLKIEAISTHLHAMNLSIRQKVRY